jgi:hypothetical protein
MTHAALLWMIHFIDALLWMIHFIDEVSMGPDCTAMHSTPILFTDEVH